jgi:hypothetical protein
MFQVAIITHSTFQKGKNKSRFEEFTELLFTENVFIVCGLQLQLRFMLRLPCLSLKFVIYNKKEYLKLPLFMSENWWNEVSDPIP